MPYIGKKPADIIATAVDTTTGTFSGDIITATAGTSNFRAGVNAGNSITSGGDKNTVVGDEAGTAIITGDFNTALGFEAGHDITTGSANTIIGGLAGDKLIDASYNVAIGSGAIGADTKGSKSIAIGYNSLVTQNFTSATDTFNVAIGFEAGKAVTTGVSNTFIGGLAGDALDTGGFNVAVGRSTLTTDVKGSKSTAIGFGTLRAQTFSGATDTMNTAVGFEAGNDITSGINNTLIGSLAGDALSDADNNTAIGYNALSGDTLGSRSTAIGYNTLLLQNFTSGTNVYNVAIGHDAGRAITTALYSTIIGGLAGVAHQTGNFNTYIGYASGTANAGDQNTLIGANAGALLTNADKNTIIGKYSGNQGGLDIRTSDNYIVLSDGDGNPRGTFDNNGNFTVGKTVNSHSTAGFGTTAGGVGNFIADSTTPLIVNRLTNDGKVISIRQASTEEGTISVSGTTVSYNGGHLARWSQLTDNTRDNTIVKGTVMTNLDQMAEWTTDGVTEDNEQLNCMVVSSVEGDANVAGVFVNWDNDDDIYTNDMNIAMTGDMVIRIAQGTTVARGDLLMSAGDGTAKTQDDDIVRSKTIAKVTSTNVSHTYDDGTYLVPCVLMAC